MKALLFTPPDKVAEVEIDNTLEALQKAVGGYIETVTLTTDACLICNEEGRIRNMETQEILNTTYYGPVLLVGTKGDEFTDAPDRWVKEYEKEIHEAMKKYVVKVAFSYQEREFEFPDIDDAARFIAMLLNYQADDCEDIDIRIERWKEKTEE